MGLVPSGVRGLYPQGHEACTPRGNDSLPPGVAKIHTPGGVVGQSSIGVRRGI